MKCVAAGIGGQYGQPGNHRLEQHSARILVVGGVQQDIATLQDARYVIATAQDLKTISHPQLAGLVGKGRGVVFTNRDQAAARAAVTPAVPRTPAGTGRAPWS